MRLKLSILHGRRTGRSRTPDALPRRPTSRLARRGNYARFSSSFHRIRGGKTCVGGEKKAPQRARARFLVRSFQHRRERTAPPRYPRLDRDRRDEAAIYQRPSLKILLTHTHKHTNTQTHKHTHTLTRAHTHRTWRAESGGCSEVIPQHAATAAQESRAARASDLRFPGLEEEEEEEKKKKKKKKKGTSLVPPPAHTHLHTHTLTLTHTRRERKGRSRGGGGGVGGVGDEAAAVTRERETSHCRWRQITPVWVSELRLLVSLFLHDVT